MKKTIVILTFLFTSFLMHSQCNSLVSGNYVVKYDNKYKKTSPDFELNIDGIKTIQKFSKKTKKSEIKWVSRTEFKFVGKKLKKSLKKEQKQMKTLGEPFYQITKCKSDTISFVYKVNPSILLNSGKIIRVENDLIAKRN